MLDTLKWLLNKFLFNKYSSWIFDIIILLCVCIVIVMWRQESLKIPTASEESPAALGPALAPAELAQRVARANDEGRVLNAETHRELGPRGAVLAVTARRDEARLRRLLGSLALVPDVSTALLVVSHSFYDEKINRLVRDVRFCRVLQIFYPHSRQLYPDRFPGPDPGDCAGGRADSFCSPRDAALVERKLHWWWTAHYVFNELGHASEGGAVLFLQEDDYVLPDALHMLRYATRAFVYHWETDVVSLGGLAADDGDPGLLTIDPWRPPLDRGLAFNASMWRRIEALAARYCSYDDVSWSYSLLHVFAGLPRGRAEAVASAAPRVRAAPGGPARAALFPERVRAGFVAAPGGRAPERLRAPPGAGGFSDPRDRLLCLDPDLGTTTGVPVSTVPCR